MERRIGETFECKGEWYQCVESDSCRCGYCDFDRLGDCDTIACKSDERKDGKEVYFNKLEKVGEMYEKRVSDVMFSTFQRYKVCSPVILPKEPYIYYNFIDSTIEIEIKQTKEDKEENHKTEDTLLTRLVGRYVNNLIDYKTFEKAVKELYSDKEENKPSLKEFDLEAAKSGKSICTRDGRKARIICFDAKGDKPIIALVEMGTAETPNNYPIDGKAVSAKESSCDLMMLAEKKEGWVNVYKNQIHDTPESAEEGHKGTADYIKTIRVEWEE